MHDCFTIELTGECLKCLFRLTGGVPAVVVQSEALWARIPEIQVRIPSRAMGTFFPHTVSSVFRLSLTHTHTHTHAHVRTAPPPPTHTYLCFPMELVGECLKPFVSTDPKRTCSRGVIGSTMGAYPRGTGSNPPSRAMGTFSPHAVSSIFRLSLTRFFRLSGGPCRCGPVDRSWSVS